ncbi:MAG: hypothetical protein AAF738_00415 [Bacteroidota bacterium]
MWDSTADKWLSDGPIVLAIDEIRYEFTTSKLNPFSLAINSFEMAEKLNWYGTSDEMPVHWKKNAKPHWQLQPRH